MNGKTIGQGDRYMVAEIKGRHASTQAGIELGTMKIGMQTAILAHNDRKFLLEIVDSQAQKIAEQAKEIERLSKSAVTVEPEMCEFCNGNGFRDVDLPADMGNHTTEDCQWCKGTGDDNNDNICCANCGLWWNELVIARGEPGNIHACSDCGGEWVRL